MGKLLKLFLHLSYTILLLTTIPTDHRWWVLVAYYGFTFFVVVSFGIHIKKVLDKKQ